MSTYYELLKKPIVDLTYDEKKRLERAAKIPPSARRLAEGRITELTAQVRKLDEEIDELREWLNGYEYDPNEKVPF